MIGKVRFCSGKVRSKVRQRAVLSPCQCGSGAGIHKDFPERVSEFEIDGKKYIVHSRFVGEKNIDEVIGRLAFERAVKETLA